MNTYYTKNGDGTFQEVTFPTKSLMEMFVESYTRDMVFETTATINEEILKAVDTLIKPLVNEKIKPAIDEHIGTINIADIVDDQVNRAVQEYDYDRIVESVADGVDIEEMVNDKVRDHLDSCCIQVRIS